VSTLRARAIACCRNRFFGAALYGLSGAKSRTAFARWCDRLCRPGCYAGPEHSNAQPLGVNTKWLRLLDEGVQLREGIPQLLAIFPELDAVYNNPLWDILGWDSDDAQRPVWFRPVYSPRSPGLVNGTFRERVYAGMKRALGIPDWSKFAWPLLILRAPKGDWQKRWLEDYFFRYVALASLAPLYKDCFSDLWALLDQWLIPPGSDPGTSRLKWPDDMNANEVRRGRLEELRQSLMACGWLPVSDQPAQVHLAMIWCISLAPRSRLDQIVSSWRAKRRCPRWLRQLMRDLDPRLNVIPEPWHRPDPQR
jgi:hypothetical protein